MSEKAKKVMESRSWPPALGSLGGLREEQEEPGTGLCPTSQWDARRVGLGAFPEHRGDSGGDGPIRLFPKCSRARLRHISATSDPPPFALLQYVACPPAR